MLNKHCCSLWLAKKLKALGAKQQSQYVWCCLPHDKEFFLRTADTEGSHPNIEKYSAFMLSELGDMLPKAARWNSGRNIKKWECEFYSRNNLILSYTDKTEVNARAKMLIDFLEEK